MESENTNEEKKESQVKPKPPRNNKKSSAGYWVQGYVLEDFFKKQSGLLFLIFFLILLFITNRYWCSKQLTEMDKLKKELARLNDNQVNLTKQITQTGSQTQIETLLFDNGIELRKNNTTIYEIKK